MPKFVLTRGLISKLVHRLIPSPDGAVPSLLKAGVIDQRWRWVFTFFAGQATPLLEMAFLASVYLMIGQESRAEFFVWLQATSWLTAETKDFVKNNLGLIALISSIFFAVSHLLLRYSYEINQMLLRYRMELSDSQRIVSAFLAARARTARRIGMGKITNAITQTAGAPGSLLTQGLKITIALWSAGVYLVGAIYLSWEMVAIGLFLFAIPLWLTRWIYSQMANVGKLKLEGSQGALNFLTDIFAGHARSLVDGLEQNLMAKSKGVIRRNFDWRIIKRRAQSRASLITDGVSTIGLLTILFLGVAILNMELATLLMLFVMFNRLRASINTIAGAAMSYVNLVPSVSLLGDVLGQLEKNSVRRNEWDVESFPPIQVASIKSIYFQYEEEGPPVLNDINFDAVSGDRILIKGPSGQGKTTLFEILCGILEPDRGEIRFNGELLNEDLFYRIRQTLGFVSPTVHLFRGTLRENLTMGAPIDEKMLEKAIRLAGLENVIAELPLGLDDDLGENGDTLSLGQRQRVILARIFLRQPSLVLLDEATANLDRALEEKITSNLEQFIDPNAIVIMIAHKEPEGFNFTKKFTMESGVLKPEVVTRQKATV
ncbi:MAG: ATP-binding cassette domain-containing protein [Alphaproteobacteria bacterium]|nr:ATP-binding cassette domain-containing protein [Alphaproteobacteria bacterium]